MAYFPNILSNTSPIGTNSDTVISGGNWSGDTYTGSGEINDYAYVGVNLQVDESGTLYFDFSQDGTNWSTYPVNGFTVASGINEVHTAWKGGRYMRPRFVGSGGRTYFRLKTYYSNLPLPLSAPLNQSIGSDQDATVVRSILEGQKLNNTFDTVPLDSTGNLRVNVTEPLAAFGELKTIQVTPQIQSEFAYGINTNQFNITTSGTFTSAYETDSMAIISCSGTNTSAVVESKGYSKYRPGQGSLARFTGLFTTGVANNTQRVGLFDESDGFGFGYNGTSFGLFNIRSGTTTWTPQTAWNIDVMDGTGSSSNPSNQLLDPTKGNVFQVNYQYLGFGAIKYFVEESTTGRFEPVHIIQYANTNTVPSLGIPSLPLRFDTINTSNSSEVIFKTGSVAAFTEGKNIVLGPFNSISNTKSVTTETNILTIKGKDTFNGKVNRISVQLQELSIGCDGNATSTIRVTKDATLGGSPSYTSISDQSSIEYDIAGTTVSNGVVISQQAVAKNQNSTVNLQEFNLFLLPGETLTFSSESTATNATTIAVSWREDF